MLADLKILEDKLYQPEALNAFISKYKVHDVIMQLNKSTKKETRDRIRYFFSKLSQSAQYKQLFSACLTEDKEQKSEFIKYVSSQHSQQFFALLQNRPEDILAIIQHNQVMIPVLTKLISFQYGIKLVKLFRKLYEQNWEKYQCLFNPIISEGLAEGLGIVEGQNGLKEVDTQAQMRYLEIVVQIAVLGGKCFDFVKNLLNLSLNIYSKQDILLKMAMVQIISVLGQSPQTSKLLRQHKIWKLVEKDACDPNQQFYVQKYLLILLVDMNQSGNYEMSQKVIKHIHVFLGANLKEKGEYLQAAVDVVAHLFQSAEGCRIVVQSMDALSGYIALSRVTFDSIKKPYYQSLINLTHTGCQSSKQAKQHPKYKICINILNCIGKPNITAELNHNLHANNYMVYGIQQFCKWFCKLLLLPFEETQLLLVEIFHNLLNYYEIAQTLLQIQDVSKYLLKTVIPNDSNKTLRSAKGKLIASIIGKGNTDWQGLQLSEYSRNLQKMLEGKQTESVYALGVQ